MRSRRPFSLSRLITLATGALFLLPVTGSAGKRPRVSTTDELWPTDPQVHALMRDEMAKTHIRKGLAPPRKLKHVQPEYPKNAAQYGIAGVVVIKGRIDATTGEPRDLQAVQGPVILAEAALKAAKLWRYQPLVIDGVRHELQLKTEIIFTLE